MKTDDEELGENVEEVLYRVDERTRSIEEEVDNISENVTENRKDIDDVQDKVKRNTTIINGVSVGGIAFVTWIADKVTRIFP